MHIQTTIKFLQIFSLIALCSSTAAQQIDLSNQTWSSEVIRERGQAVIPLYDGWYPNEDGTKTICF